MKYRIIILLTLLPLFSLAQTEKDSLALELELATIPTIQFDLLLKLLDMASSQTAREPVYLDYLTRAHDIATSLQNDSLLSQFHYIAGSYYLKREDEISGLEHFFKSIRLSREIGDSLVLSNVNYKIGAYHYWKEEVEKALSYFEDAIQIFPKLNKKQRGQARNFLGKAVALQELKRFEESMEYHQKALAIKKKEKAYKHIPVSLNNIAGLYLSMGDTVKAVEMWNETIIMADSLGLMDARTYAEYVIGMVLEQQGKFAEAIPYFEKSIKWWEGQDASKDLLRAYPLAAETYARLNRDKKAIDAFRKSQTLTDKHYNESKLKAIQEQETKYQTEKKVLENENLKKTNELIQTRNTQYLIGFAIVTGLLGLLGFFFVQMRRTKRQLDIQNKTIEQQNVKLTELDRLKTNFFSSITHEFRTPLTLILEPLRQLLKEDHTDTIKQRLQLAKNNSEKLLQLVNQLLDVSKLEAGKMSMDLRKGEVMNSLQPIFESFSLAAQRKGIDLKWTIANDLPPFFYDKNHLEKICYNLLSNAIKFTEEGMVEIEVSSSRQNTTAITAPESLMIKVRDTGIGIPAKQLDQIFERFYQVDASTTRKNEGTGIGLALTKELVELMGGSISVKSESGVETIFTASVPMYLSLDSDQVHQPVVVEEILLSPSVNGKSSFLENGNKAASKSLDRILIVEDNAELLLFIQQSLQQYYQVEVAVDGEEGIRKAKELTPDLIISDLMMPKKDGFELIDDLKNDIITSHIPIVLLTAKSAIESKLQGLRRGADDYLTKPFNTEELLARMANLIEIRKKLQKIYAGVLPESEAERELELISPLDQAFLEQIRKYLKSNLDNTKLSVESLSQKVFMSRSQLFRKLKALTGQTPSLFIRSYRLEQAMEMLKSREGNVSQIALSVGFEDAKYFSKRFKERFGHSPNEV